MPVPSRFSFPLIDSFRSLDYATGGLEGTAVYTPLAVYDPAVNIFQFHSLFDISFKLLKFELSFFPSMNITT